MAERPSGTVTFLFTDIEGSTRSWAREPEAMRHAIAAHDEIVRGAIEAAGGYVFATGGDSFAAAFATPAGALAAAATARDELASRDWETLEPLRVRMGLHTGTAEERDANYFGPQVNRAARLMACGHGGQLLASSTTAALIKASTTLFDLGEHRLADIDSPERVSQVGEGAFPPLRAVRAFRSTLPETRSELIGRASELTEIQCLLAESRLVTLIGTGGTGKTRLAIEAARDAVPRFEDGVWFVDLTVIAKPDAVAAAIADDLEIDRGTEPLQSVIAAMASADALLVVDNCEHVIDAAADVLDGLLAGCPEMRVLATSRESIEVDGETVFPVSPLDPGTTGVELFEKRAASAGVLEAELDPAQVAALCARLDGLPLAIELAAARARTLRPTELMAHLDAGGELTSGRRRGRRRHETLQTTMEWSYRLLEDDEQQMLRSLAVLESDFPLAAAAAVSDLPRGRADDLVEGLVAKSLVRPVPSPSGDGTSWFGLLETIRDFAARQLLHAGEDDVARDRLVDYVIHMLDGYPDSTDRYHDVWLPIGTQRASIDAAWDHAAQRSDPTELAEILIVGSNTWHIAPGRSDDAQLDQLVALLDADEFDTNHTALLLASAAQFATIRRQVDRAQDLASRAVRAADAAGLDLDGAIARTILAFLIAYVDPDQARKLSDEALASSGAADAPRDPRRHPLARDEGFLRAWLSQNRADVLHAAGAHEAGYATSEAVARTSFQDGAFCFLMCEVQLLWASLLIGRSAEALAITPRQPTPPALLDWRAVRPVARAAALAATGDVDRAERDLLAVAEGPVEMFFGEDEWLTALGVVAFHAGDHDRAARLFRRQPGLTPVQMMVTRHYLARMGIKPSAPTLLESAADVTVDVTGAAALSEAEMAISRRRLTT